MDPWLTPRPPPTMPAANPTWLRLTPAGGATHPTLDYLKAQPPACSSSRGSLALLALLIVICLVILHLSVIRSSSHSLSTYPLVAHTVGNVDTDAANQGPGPAVDEKGRKVSKNTDTNLMGAMKSERVRFADARASPLTINPQWNSSIDDSSLGLMSRPPPAPPLTPPELSTSVFTFTKRSSHDQDSFMHQPNPDYMSSTASPSSSTNMQRRSYTRMIQAEDSSQTTSPTGYDPANSSYLSTSYPPTTSLLPPPPPGLQDEDEDAVRRGRQIEVKGEIISALDGVGAGWTRHTRVYGGGVCLACAATGGSHGNGGGGFYGANVSPEEMH